MRLPDAVAYLQEHLELFRTTDKEIVAALKTAGLVSATTHYRDCNIGRLRQLSWRRKSDAGKKG